MKRVGRVGSDSRWIAWRLVLMTVPLVILVGAMIGRAQSRSIGFGILSSGLRSKLTGSQPCERGECLDGTTRDLGGIANEPARTAGTRDPKQTVSPPPTPVGLDGAEHGFCPDGAPVDPCLVVVFHGVGGNSLELVPPGQPEPPADVAQLMLHDGVFIPAGGTPGDAFTAPLMAAGCDVLYARWNGLISWDMRPDALSEVMAPIRREIEARDAENLPGEGPTRVYLHGHSGGGLVIARILESAATDDDAAFIADRVTRATTMSSPFGGSPIADLLMDERIDHPLGGGTQLEDVDIQNILSALLGSFGGDATSDRVGPLTSKYMERHWADAPSRTVPIGTIGTGHWKVPLPGPEAHPRDYTSYFFGSVLGHNGKGPVDQIIEKVEVIPGLLRDIVPDADGDGDVDTNDLFAGLSQNPPTLYDPATHEIVINASVLDLLGPKGRKAFERLRAKIIGNLRKSTLVNETEATRFVDGVIDRIDLRVSLAACQVSSALDAGWYENCREDLFSQIDGLLALWGPLDMAVSSSCVEAFGWDPLWPIICDEIRDRIFKDSYMVKLRPPTNRLNARDLLPAYSPSLVFGASPGLKCTDGIVPCISSLGELLAARGTRIPGPTYPLGFVGVNHVRAMFNTPAAIARFDSEGVLQQPEYPNRIGEWYLEEVVCDGTPIPQIVLDGGTIEPDLDAIRHRCTYEECVSFYMDEGIWEDWADEVDACIGTFDLCPEGGAFDLSAFEIPEAGGDWGRPPVACQPLSCAPDQCGAWPDGCGGTIQCGPCASTCPKGTCVCDTPAGPVCEDANGLCPDGTACEPE